MISASVLLSLLLGTTVTGALTATQIAALAGIGIKLTPQIIAILQKLDTPEFRAWAARNGDAVIPLQPGISSER